METRMKQTPKPKQEEPRLLHSQTQNGFFCQYYGEDLNGIGGFSPESPELAELNMWEIIHKIRSRMCSTAPSISEFPPRESGHRLIEPILMTKPKQGSV